MLKPSRPSVSSRLTAASTFFSAVSVSRAIGATVGRLAVASPPTIAPVLVAELLVEGERWPVYVHVIDHPDARVLVDTGMTELHPEVADLDPRLLPLSKQTFDLAGIDVVVNTHLHFDHCGGNHLLAG
jgi:N-acyl homoserine lactone hydrolase